MAITDELRRFASLFSGVWFKCDGTAVFTTGIPPIDADRGDKYMLQIADRIDEKHSEAQRRWMAELDAARDRDGYIALPVDADCEPIHVGDEMECWDDRSIEPFEVRSLVFDGETWTVCDRLGPQVIPRYLRHRKQPTVEDVLRQFLGECESARNLGYDDVPQEVFAEYATKLRLAGEGE